ncbi:MAG: DUF3095 domain-containing protein [Alphaproteobacteria bacterium]|nr:DUF3095 domain-containing protein [Alphaproteobacteria bacterium]
MARPAAHDDRFYTDLPPFEDFDRVADPSAFLPVPDDWHVVLADIRGSTRAIAEGRYKDVNMLGAACITAACNAAADVAPDIDIAYIFGGDGATLLIPGSLLDPIRSALLGAANLARREFDLELRIGAVAVRELRADGVDVTLGKLRLSPGNELAAAGGGGVLRAERLIKSDPVEGGRYRFSVDSLAKEPDMTGLSCRWEPLNARLGVMLCLIVLARPRDPEARRSVYNGVLQEVERILGGDLTSASPVTVKTMRFRWIPNGLRMEARLTRGQRPTWRRYLWLLFESLVQFLLEKFNWSAGGYDAPSYRKELRANSDYRRFDDVLRLTLDCSPEQADAIEALLERLREVGEIVYGTHRADHALMTCLVFNLDEGEHVHFVDGGDGGFTAASLSFKAQLNSLE